MESAAYTWSAQRRAFEQSEPSLFEIGATGWDARRRFGNDGVISSSVRRRSRLAFSVLRLASRKLPRRGNRRQRTLPATRSSTQQPSTGQSSIGQSGTAKSLAVKSPAISWRHRTLRVASVQGICGRGHADKRQYRNQKFLFDFGQHYSRQDRVTTQRASHRGGMPRVAIAAVTEFASPIRPLRAEDFSRAKNNI